MTNHIISLEGIDNSGKTTLIKNAIQMFRAYSVGDVSSTIHIKPHTLNKKYPSNQKEVRDFFVCSPIEEVVRVLLEINKKKSDILMKSSGEYGFLDRGFLTTVSSCAARIQVREGKTLSESLTLVEQVNKEVKYSPCEKDAIILSLDPNSAIDIFKQRESSYVEEDYLSYLKTFIDTFSIVSVLKRVIGHPIPRIHKINADNNIEIVSDDLLSVIKKITNIRYKILMQEFLESIDDCGLDSVIIGGSYLRGDIVPNWSDLDSVCILRDENKVDDLIELTERLSEKYDVRFNPEILSLEDINEPSSLPMKVLMFFLPDYHSKAVIGKKYDLGLDINLLKARNKEEFSRLLSFYNSLVVDLEKGIIDQENFVSRGLRVCFNLTKIALFDKNIIIASYEDTVNQSHINKIGDAEMLNDLLDVRNNWNYHNLDFENVIIQIRDYISNFRSYFENE